MKFGYLTNKLVSVELNHLNKLAQFSSENGVAHLEVDSTVVTLQALTK